MYTGTLFDYAYFNARLADVIEVFDEDLTDTFIRSLEAAYCHGWVSSDYHNKVLNQLAEMGLSM